MASKPKSASDPHSSARIDLHQKASCHCALSVPVIEESQGLQGRSADRSETGRLTLAAVRLFVPRSGRPDKTGANPRSSQTYAVALDRGAGQMENVTPQATLRVTLCHLSRILGEPKQKRTEQRWTR